MQQPIQVRFGKHLRKLRTAKGKTVEKIAYESEEDLSKSTVSRIENGLVDPRLSTLEKIALSLEVGLTELMDF